MAFRFPFELIPFESIKTFQLKSELYGNKQKKRTPHINALLREKESNQCTPNADFILLLLLPWLLLQQWLLMLLLVLTSR